MTLKVGQRIQIKDNAFAGSSDPADFIVRGKIGIVEWDLGDGAYEVEVDGELWPLCDDDLELIQD